MYLNEIIGGTLYNAYLEPGKKELIIPDGVETLEWGAFRDKASLERVVFPATLKAIPSFCFNNNSRLENITIPGSVKTIEQYSFGGCTALERVILSDGIEIIEEYAFFGCRSMQFVKLPSTLTAIGAHAFGNCMPSKIIALPKSISKIGEDAFVVSTDRASPIFLVEAGSFAEKYVASQGYKYRILESVDGFVNNTLLYRGKLFAAEKSTDSVRISANVSVIASGAFEGHAEIERVVFPSTVIEIQRYAFAGCTAIQELTFHSGIKSIGEKAFYDTHVRVASLPASIEVIMPDAFPPECIISIDGEMPFYRQKLEDLQKRRDEIKVWEETLDKLKRKKEVLEAQMSKFTKARPEELDQIPTYQEQTVCIQAQISEQKSEFDKRRKSYTLLQQTCQSELNALKIERKKCFFLAASKKKELDDRISEKENELQAIRDDAEQLQADEAEAMSLLESALASAAACLKPLMALAAQRKSVLQRQKLSIESTAAEIEAYTLSIATSKDELLHAEHNLEAAHSSWLAAKKKAELAAKEAHRKRELQRKLTKAAAQKASLIKKIGKPKYTVSKLYEYIPHEAIVEERLLNQCFLNMLLNQNEANRIAAYRLFAEEHSNELEQIRELNLSLGCAENDGINDFSTQDEAKPVEVNLPDRFVTLNDYFKRNDSWKRLRLTTNRLQNGKRVKQDLKETLFKGMEYLRMPCVENTALLFPYCLVIYERNEQIRVFTYDRVRISVECTKRTKEYEEDTKLPPHCELLSERRKYLNKDGSQDMRYKNNPIVKEYRYTSIIIMAEKKRIVFPVDTRDSALQFEEAFNQHVETLCRGIQKSIYAKVCASEEPDSIRQAITDLSIAEKKRKDCERKKAEEESQRIESERLAAQLSAEKKRKEIIQRQREINEERKRQEREKEAASRQLAKLFDDDVIDEHAGELTQSDGSPNLPIEVVGNRLISNTVFKITLHAVSDLSIDEITALFVSKAGMSISNRKKLTGLSGEENITLGFVLDSGVDYTTMKECFLRLDSQNGTLGDIAFRMNISFCSDF